MSRLQRRLLGLPSTGNYPDYLPSPDDSQFRVTQTHEYAVKRRAAERALEEQEAEENKNVLKKAAESRFGGDVTAIYRRVGSNEEPQVPTQRKSVFSKLAKQFAKEEKDIKRDQLMPSSQREKKKDSVKSPKAGERKETIKVIMNGHERHVRLTVAGKVGVSKDKVQNVTVVPTMS